MRRFIMCAALAVGLLFAPAAAGARLGPAAAGDWPQLGHDAQHTHSNPDEHTLTTGNVGQLVAGWNLSDAAGEPPVAVGGHLYVEAGPWVRSYNAASGELEWSFTTITPNGNYTVPLAVSDGVVYAPANDGTRSILYALDAATGKKLWSMPKVCGIPSVADATLFLDEGFYACARAGVTSIDIATHTVNWKSNVGSNPSVAGGHVYVTTDAEVSSLDEATGALEWTSKNLIGPVRDRIDTQVTVANGLLYVAIRTGTAYALDPANGRVRWTTQVSDNYTTDFAVANGMVYIAGRNNGLHATLHALNAATGKQVWTFKASQPIVTDPTVANGVVYVSSYDKHLTALDAATGAKLWDFLAGGSPLWDIVVSNGALYASFATAHLRTFQLPA